MMGGGKNTETENKLKYINPGVFTMNIKTIPKELDMHN